MNNIKIIVVACFSLILISCSKSEQSNILETKRNDEKNLKIKNSPSKEVIEVLAKDRLKKRADNAASIKERSVSINGEKFLYEGKLEKGTQVRNIHMSEKGRIRGSIVIVVNPGETLSLAFNNQTKIAKDTYRLIPEKTEDLMTIYKELMQNKSITIVELEIDYSRENSRKATF
jgi:hypothetical protein